VRGHITNFPIPQNVLVKKSFNIWQRYEQKYVAYVFGPHCMLCICITFDKFHLWWVLLRTVIVTATKLLFSHSLSM